MKRRKRKINAKLTAALTVGAILNVIVLLILGGVTVYKYIAPKSTKLEAPPALRPISLPTVRYHKEKSKDRQESSKRPRQKPIKARSIDSISTPDIELQYGNVGNSVSVGSSGDMDLELGGIGGLGGKGNRLGIGESAVDFFGIKNQGERIVIIVDIAQSMLEVDRGDIPGFERVKERVLTVLDDLRPTTLFNVMLFENGLDVMSNSLVLATPENKIRAAKFFKPYWETQGGRLTPGAIRGSRLHNYTPEYTDIVPRAGNSRMDMALLAAFEQKADAIFMVTDGTPHVVRDLTEKERKDYDARYKIWERAYNRASNAEKEQYERVIEQWERNRARGGTAAEIAERNERGLDAEIREDYEKPMPPWGVQPPLEVRAIRGDAVFIDWMEDNARRIYGDRKRDLPSLNIIGYSIPERGHTAKFLNNFRRAFPNGNFKVFGEYLGEDEES